MAFFKRKPKAPFEGEGLVLFYEVQEAMQAEKRLRDAGYSVKLVAPPPELRKGCDLAVAINLVEQPGIERALAQGDVAYISISPLNTATSEILEIARVVDFGRWLRVRAGNMKLTVEKESGVIVNTSGGGCPDIPWLHLALLGKKLEESPRPRNVAYTLCALMLDRALEKAIEITREDR